MSMFRFAQPAYPEEDVKPMRDELEVVGAVSLRTPEAVDEALSPKNPGTAFVVVNSVCGCAAGGARPGVSAALQNKTIPDRLYTVFAGVDREATQRAREHAPNVPPSSPSAMLFRDGKLVYMLHRHDIEGATPDQIAERLATAFNEHCERKGPSIPAEQFEKLRFVQVCGSALAEKARKRREG